MDHLFDVLLDGSALAIAGNMACNSHPDHIASSLADIGARRRLCRRPSRAAAEVVTKYIITDMYAKAVQGMPAEDAVKWAHAELVKIYA
jgi:hypothetical protein